MSETLRERELDAESGAPVYELVPAPAPRVVGPGRRERAYLQRVAALERDVALHERELAERARDLAAGERARAEQADELARRTRELEVSALVERGAVRAATKLERKLAAADAESVRLQQAQNRLLVALGALQRENELLRERLALAPAGGRARAQRLDVPAP